MNNTYEVHVWQLIVNAYESKSVDQVRTELKAIIDLLRLNQEFLNLMVSPTVVVEHKKTIVKEVFGDEFSKLFMDFLMLLIENHLFDRIEVLAEVYEKTIAHYLEDLAGVIEGEVYSAVALTKEQLEQLTMVFSKKLDKQVHFTSVIDKSLLGGYKVKISDHVYDHTVKTHLKQLKQSFKDGYEEEAR